MKHNGSSTHSQHLIFNYIKKMLIFDETSVAGAGLAAAAAPPKHDAASSAATSVARRKVMK